MRWKILRDMNSAGRKQKARRKYRTLNNVPRAVILSFFVGAGKNGKFTVSAGSQSVSVSASGEPIRVAVPLYIKPNSSEIVHFIGEMGRMKTDHLPGETRDLHFYVKDMQLRIDLTK